eukprot:scaffold2738_cov366-Prasinococcus_capsulatus_cf.AAC.8
MSAHGGVTERERAPPLPPARLDVHLPTSSWESHRAGLHRQAPSRPSCRATSSTRRALRHAEEPVLVPRPCQPRHVRATRD